MTEPTNIDASQGKLPPHDDITTFLGTISSEEYELRRQIRTCRNAAAFKRTLTNNRDALVLCWMVYELAGAWVYTLANLKELSAVRNYLCSLLSLADQAEVVEALK